MAKKGKKYALRDVRNALQRKNYGQANLFFSNVRIKKGQEEEAATLQHTVLCALTLKYFKHREYSKCIQYIKQQTPSLSQASDHLQLISGLAYFFLTDYENAIPLLQPIVKKPAFASFRFYYLLCLVYQDKDATLVGINELPDAKQRFLEVARLFQQKSYKKATDLLAKISPESNSEFQNMNLLSHILKDEDSSHLKDNPKLRPLYRAMTHTALSKSEIEYLSSFPALTNEYTLSTTTTTRFDPHIILEPVQLLCNKGIPLSKEVLKSVLQAPDEILPTLLFNQIAALFRQDKEAHLDDIFALIRPHYVHLCKVPEFIFILVDFLDFSQEEKISLPLDAIVKHYVANFKDTWTVEKAAVVSIQLSEIFHNIKPDNSVSKKVSLLGQQYTLNNNLVTLSWDCFSFYCTSPPQTVKWVYLSLFTRSIDPVAKAMIRNDFISMLNMINATSSPSFASMGFEFSGYEIGIVIQAMKKHLFDMFEQLLIEQPPLKSDSFPMELLLIIRGNLQFNAEQENQFKKLWAKYAEYFNEAQDSDLQKKYNHFITEEALTKEDYQDYFQTKKKYTQAKKEGKDLIKLLDMGAVKIIQLIDRNHFDDDALNSFEALLTYAKKGIKYGLNQNEVLQVFQKFVEEYVKLCRDYDCEHPTEFFYYLIKEILSLPPSRIKVLDLLIAETCLKAGSQFVFNNRNIYRAHISIIEKYINTFIKLTKQDAFIPLDVTFIKKLSKEVDRFIKKKKSGSWQI